MIDIRMQPPPICRRIGGDFIDPPILDDEHADVIAETLAGPYIPPRTHATLLERIRSYPFVVLRKRSSVHDADGVYGILVTTAALRGVTHRTATYRDQADNLVTVRLGYDRPAGVGQVASFHSDAFGFTSIVDGQHIRIDFVGMQPKELPESDSISHAER